MDNKNTTIETFSISHEEVLEFVEYLLQEDAVEFREGHDGFEMVTNRATDTSYMNSEDVEILLDVAIRATITLMVEKMSNKGITTGVSMDNASLFSAPETIQ